MQVERLLPELLEETNGPETVEESERNEEDAAKGFDDKRIAAFIPAGVGVG